MTKKKQGGRAVLGRIGWMACASAVFMPALGCASRSVEVQQYGRMHDVLSGGAERATAKIALAEVMQKPHAYGVGALARLEGEITIIDGQALAARPKGHGLHVDGPSPDLLDGAAILTVAHVDGWDDIRVDRDLGQADLEAFIAEQARERGFDLQKPIPFLVEGKVTDLQAHVINGECPMRPGVRLTAEQRPWRFQSDQPRHATIVGFYTADSVGHMTHPGTCVHAHAVFDAEGKPVTGHIERMAVASGATLKLPKVR